MANLLVFCTDIPMVLSVCIVTEKYFKSTTIRIGEQCYLKFNNIRVIKQYNANRIRMTHL